MGAGRGREAKYQEKAWGCDCGRTGDRKPRADRGDCSAALVLEVLEMTSRERVLAALRLEVLDRVPYVEIGVDPAVADGLLGRGRYSGGMKRNLVTTTSMGWPSEGGAPLKSHRLRRAFSFPGAGMSAPV